MGTRTPGDRNLSPTDRRMLRVAVIGTGFVGPHHVDAVRRGGYAEVVALVGSDLRRTEARARALGVARASDDALAVVRDETIDVVHICTPNSSHMELARAALAAGRHVVVEKPLTLTSADADELVGLARRVGRHGAVAFTYRGYPLVRRARELVAEGALGEVRLVHGGYLQDWLLEATDDNWRVDATIGGASRAVADVGSHWFDSAEFVTGHRVTEVIADLATCVPTRTSEDAATILVRFDNGAHGACVVSQVSAGRKNAFTLEVGGARRSLAWAQEQPNELWLGSRDPAGATIVPRQPEPVDAGVPALPPGHPEGWGDALRDALRPFYAAVAAGEPVPEAGAQAAYPTLADGARAVRFVEAVLASPAAGRWMPIAG